MDTVADILKDKGGTVHMTTADATVLAAVETMCEARVGALLICEEGVPIGIITERDLMRRVLLPHHDPAKMKVADVMTRNLVAVAPSASTGEVMSIMTQARCRHLPVISGEGRLVGVVSIGDVVRWHSRLKDYQIRMLTDFVEGRYPG